MRRLAADWEKIFSKDTSDQRLLFRMHNELLKLNTESTTCLENEPETLTGTSAKELHRQQKKKKVKKCSTSCVIRKMQIKTTVMCYFTPITELQIWSTDTTKC